MTTYVLIHGSFFDASCWDRVAGALRERGHTVVAPDLPGHGADDVERALARLRPDPLALNVTPLSVTAERWGKLPRSYVETTEDRVIPIAAQRVMVSRTPVDRVHTLAASHAPFLSPAAELADILAGA